MKSRALLSFILLFFCLSINSSLFGQENDEEHEEKEKLEVGGYGEILYRHFDYGLNQRATPKGSVPDSRATLDIPRFVFKMESHFTDDLYLEAEVEFEHLGTGSALELEYDEFGEYEFEAEKGGEITLEELHLTKSFSEALNLRAGRIIVPVGQLSRAHYPTDYFTTIRPESETTIIPSVWNETGIEIFGKFSDFNYRFQVINGLESSGFSSANWIQEGHQTKFETVKATNLAYAARFDFTGLQNLNIGVGGYYGNANDNRPKPEDLEGIDGHVTIGEVHGEYKNDNFIARGMFLYGTLENSDLISQQNARISRNIQSPRTPVAKAAMAYYAEAGYNVLNLFDKETTLKLFPFARYEYYNSMEEVEASVFADPRFKRDLITFGVNFFVLPNVVIKADYQMRKVGGFDSSYNDENTFGLSIGFYDWFLKF